MKAKVPGRKTLGQVASIVTPDTLLRWFRNLVARKYDGISRRGRGRPRKRDEIADFVLGIADENQSFRIYANQGCLAQSRNHRRPKYGQAYSQ